MDRRPHVLAMAYPAQGHWGPLMKLCQWIADHGIKFTFVCPESIRNHVFSEFPTNGEVIQNQVNMVSIPVGFEPGDNREEGINLAEAMSREIPVDFENLIRRINLSDDDDKISCILHDAVVNWALEVANKLAIQTATFWTFSEVGYALGLHIN